MPLTWANLLSALRLALVPLFAWLLLDGRSAGALLVFVIAGVTDMLDGLVARSWRQQSRLGAYLDPAADKVLLTAAYLILSAPIDGWPRVIPFFVFILVLLRDLIIVIGALIIYWRIRFNRFVPLRLSKWNTACQILGVFVVLIADVARTADHAAAPALIGLAHVVVILVVAFTVVSGLEYAYRFIYRYGDLAEQMKEERRSS